MVCGAGGCFETLTAQREQRAEGAAWAPRRHNSHQVPPPPSRSRARTRSEQAAAEGLRLSAGEARHCQAGLAWTDRAAAAAGGAAALTPASWGPPRPRSDETLLRCFAPLSGAVQAGGANLQAMLACNATAVEARIRAENC